MHRYNPFSAKLARALLVAPLLAAPGLPQGAEPPSSSVNAPSTAKLQRLVPGVEVGQPDPSPVTDIFRVRVGSEYVYLTVDGRHAFTGDLLDLDSGQNLTEQHRSSARLAALGTFPESDLVLFQAEGDEKARILVFTDTSCPYCGKLHEEVQMLQQAGVAVGYIPFPRGGKGSEGEGDLRAVWCAEDRKRALNIAKGLEVGELGKGDCEAAAAVDRGYRLGTQLGVRGTPTIVFPDGTVVPGYVKAAMLLARLGLGDTSADR